MSPWLLALSACAHPSLQLGARVVPAEAAPSQACQEVGTVVGSSYGSILHGDSLAGYAVNDVRNQAADLGATTVVLRGTLPSAHACRVTGTIYKCPAGSPPGVEPAPGTPPVPTPSSPGGPPL